MRPPGGGTREAGASGADRSSAPGGPPGVAPHQRGVNGVPRAGRGVPFGTSIALPEVVTPMQFGFTLKPEHSIERTLALTRQAEAAGFAYGWLFDSHVLWRDPYPLLTLMAGVTERLRLGTCVTNPGTREPSVTASALATPDEISGGRMDLGIGRGDSARRVLGKPPITMAHTEEAIRVIRALVEGRTVTYEGTELVLPWSGKWTLPVWVAGYGPMALAM